MLFGGNAAMLNERMLPVCDVCYRMLSLSPGLTLGSLATAAFAFALLFTAEAVAPPVSPSVFPDSDLVKAALAAEGSIGEQELEADCRRFEAWAEQLRRINPSSRSDREQVEAIFAFLHREILTGEYSKPASHLHSALHGGDYNCVSATILFVALCERCGLQPQIWSAPGHVLCRFSFREPLDVETTCPEWFDTDRPGSAPRRGLREISHAQLIGKVYYNRGIVLLQNGEFTQALAALRTSVRLDPQDRDARDNLLAGLNNAAIAACSADDFAEAAELLAEARAIDPEYPPLKTNDMHVHQRWVVQLCESGQYASAIELLERGLARGADAPLFDSGRLTVYDLWARERLAAGALHEARDLVDIGLALRPDHAALLRTQRQIAATTSPAAQSAAR